MVGFFERYGIYIDFEAYIRGLPKNFNLRVVEADPLSYKTEITNDPRS